MKRYQVIIIHLLFWATFVIAPFFMFSFSSYLFTPESYYFMLQNAQNAMVFYLAYFFLIPFVVKRRSFFTMIWSGLAFMAILGTLRYLSNPWLKDILGAFQRWPVMGDNWKVILYPFFWTFMFLIYAYIVYLSIEWFRERQYRFELVREKQQSEIDLLKSQVSPHFLMNTLNNLYSLVYKGSEQASNAVLKLSEIMRYMLYDTQSEMVPLEQEIQYLHSYIDLQMLRYSNKEFIEFSINGDPAGKKIAPVLLVPFVENAFKHGNKNLPGACIMINLTVEERRIIFQIKNLKASKNVNKVIESGVGLNNIQKRLELHYPGKHILEISDELDFFNVHLIIET
ncbi:MAG: histidine kinase [Bacteroidales bacterium]|nr:histidine kinase [Bacteroidales bacterium]